jgi:hypothetical protein
MTLRVQRRVFSIVVIVTLGLFAFFAVVVAQPSFIGGIAGDPSGGHIGEHFREPHHRIHDLAFGFLLGTTAVGMLVQVRAPAKNVAGQLMAAIPILGLLLVAIVSDRRVLSVPWVAVGAPTIVATLLHPDLFRSGRMVRLSRPMIVLVAVAALPLLAFVLNNIGLQRDGSSDHAALGHYGYMAAFGITIVGLGVVSSLRLAGWRLAAWATGSLAALLGIASLAFPDIEGRLAMEGALAAIAWGAAYISVAELVGGGDRTAS